MRSVGFHGPPSRVGGALIVAGVCALPLQVQESREARLLELVEQMRDLPASWLPMIESGREAAEIDAERTYPSVTYALAFCGNSYMGTVRGERAREVGRRAFAIYGLQAAEHTIANVSASVRIDGADSTRRVGFELRGKDGSGMFDRGGPEPEDEGLEALDLAYLKDRGWRLHVADIGDFPCLDADQFTPTLAFLVGVVEFLNEVTEGEDVDLGGLIFGHAVVLPPVGELAPPDEERVELTTTGAPLRFTIDPPKQGRVLSLREYGSASSTRNTLESRAQAQLCLARVTRGPVQLSWNGYLDDAPLSNMKIQVTVTQQAADGTRLSFAATSPTLFLPSTFDAARRFDVEMRVPPGRLQFQWPLRLGFASSAE